MKFFSSATIFLFLSACTSAVAPEGTPASKTRADALSKKASNLEKVKTGLPQPDIRSPINTDPPDAAGDDIVIPEGEVLGVITEESGDLFGAASVYATYDGTKTQKSLIITVTENEERDTKFRKVVKWTCHTCRNIDPRCTEPVIPTDGTYYLLFSSTIGSVPAAGITAASNESGYPAKDLITLTGNASNDYFENPGFFLQTQTNSSTSGHSGTIQFNTKPAAVGDPFEIRVSLTLNTTKSNATPAVTKTHSALLSGKVFERVTGSAVFPADCDANSGKFAVPTYE